MEVPNTTHNDDCNATTVVKGALYTDVDHCMDILAKESREPPIIATTISNGFANINEFECFMI